MKNIKHMFARVVGFFSVAFVSAMPALAQSVTGGDNIQSALKLTVAETTGIITVDAAGLNSGIIAVGVVFLTLTVIGVTYRVVIGTISQRGMKSSF